MMIQLQVEAVNRGTLDDSLRTKEVRKLRPFAQTALTSLGWC